MEQLSTLRRPASVPAAALAALTAGHPDAARRMVAEALPHAADPVERAELIRLRARLSTWSGPIDLTAWAELLETAERIADEAPDLSAAMICDAAVLAAYTRQLAQCEALAGRALQLTGGEGTFGALASTGLGIAYALTGNIVPGRTQANLVLVGIGADRTVTLDVHAGPMHLLADLVGYQLGDRPAVSPQRVLDSRIGLGTSPYAKQGPVQLRLPDSVPADAAVVWLNVTVTGASAPGHVTAYAAGAPKPATSNVNVKTGQTQANLVAVPVGANRSVVLDVHGGGMHLIADVVGWQPAR